MTMISNSRRHCLCLAFMLILCMGNTYAQSVVDFGTDLQSTKYYESMNAANPPAGEWYAVDYDDSSWNTYTNPLDFPEYDAFWVRRTFVITDDPANHSFQLKIAHDDSGVFYINGHLIHNDWGCGRYDYIDVPSEYLVNGTNVLAVYVIDTGGDQCLECFISATDGSNIITDLPTVPLLLLSKSKIRLYYGATGYSDYSLTARLLTPTGFVDTQVSWTSSNHDILSVTDGHVLPLTIGHDIVTVSVVYEGITYSKECEVEVCSLAPDSKIVIVDESGSLGSLLTDDEKNKTSSLTVVGNLNNEDMSVLKYMAGQGKLSDLDIYETSIQSIPNGAFSYCNSLTSIVLPAGLTSIGESTFEGCSSLSSVVLPYGLTNIGYSAFSNCSSLRYIDIPNGVTRIGDRAFYCCSSLISITIPDSIEYIGQYAFYQYDNSLLSTVIIPSSVTHRIYINYSSFQDCNKIRFLVLTGDDVADYNSLSNLHTNTTVDVFFIVPDELFEQYLADENWNTRSTHILTPSMLETKTIELEANPNKSSLFTELGNNTIYTANLKIKGSINGYDIMTLRNKAIRLMYLDLSEAVIVSNDDGYEYYTGCSLISDNELGEKSFFKTNIREIILPNNLKTIGREAFKECRYLEKVVCNDSLNDISQSAFYQCDLLKDINLPNDVENIGESAFWGCTSLGPTLIIPDKVTNISGSSFGACTKLDSVFIGNNVITIGYGAFGDCKMRYVKIGRNVTQIDSHAFSTCRSLKEVIFNNKLSIIGERAFYDCYSLSNAMLPYTVESIGASAFEGGLNLKAIKIPSMVKKIGEKAFGGCDNIENVYTYTVEPTKINQNTFSCFTTAMLNVPKTSADLYIYNTQWSQFLFVQEFDEPYDAFYLNGDVELTDETGRMSGEPDAEMYETSGFIIEGDATQELSTIELSHNGTNGASIISSAGQVGGTYANLTAKSMNVNISVEKNRWYFFCFPFNVDRDSIECTSDYMIYSYDGFQRATTGTGWKKLAEDNVVLQKGSGYIFQASKTGILTVHVNKDYLNFAANNESELLHAYESDDVSNASWNFLGNPFISYYDVQDLSREYDAPIVVWNGHGYDAYKPGDDDYQLKPLEAIFVQKPNGKSVVEFLPENRITYNQARELTAMRASRRARYGTEINPERQLVNITIMDKDSVTDKTRIVYSTKAAMDYEIGVDAAKFQADGVPQIYTLNGTTKYAINERPMGTDDIKLGYTAPKSGTYTLSIPRKDAEVEIYDNVAQAVVDFTFGDYSFTTKAGTYNDRFVIHRTGGVTAIENGFRLDGLTVTSTDGGLDIEGRLAGKIAVYTESGMLVAEPAQTGHLLLGDGVYIVKIGERSVKISVN